MQCSFTGSRVAQPFSQLYVTGGLFGCLCKRMVSTSVRQISLSLCVCVFYFFYMYIWFFSYFFSFLHFSTTLNPAVAPVHRSSLLCLVWLLIDWRFLMSTVRFSPQNSGELSTHRKYGVTIVQLETFFFLLIGMLCIVQPGCRPLNSTWKKKSTTQQQ